MDGFKENKDIVVVGATNRVKYLDGALLRSGRFDTKLAIKLPTEAERYGILDIHLRKKNNKISKDVIKEIAR